MTKGTTAAIIGGIVAVVVGAVFLVTWRNEFWTVFKGSIGPLLALGGLLVIAIGWSEYKAAIEMEKLTSQTPSTTSPTPSTPAEQTQTEPSQPS